MSSISEPGRLFIGSDFSSGAIQSGAFGSGALPTGKNAGLMDIVTLYGTGSFSGAATAVSGQPLASGTYTPRLTGKVVIRADAYVGGIFSGFNTTLWLESGTGTFVSGIQSGTVTTPQTFFSPNSGVSISWATSFLQSGLTVGTAYPIALMVNQGLSGVGSLVISEQLN